MVVYAFVACEEHPAILSQSAESSRGRVCIPRRQISFSSLGIGVALCNPVHRCTGTVVLARFWTSCSDSAANASCQGHQRGLCCRGRAGACGMQPIQLSCICRVCWQRPDIQGPLHCCNLTNCGPSVSNDPSIPRTEDMNGFQQEGFGQMDMTVTPRT